ncbi:undecaprenyl/decaprenyl-phosphate alpha-N-acetylglucosaminyl 1-phosphate transferase [Patescibacteria group bacterium]|nr:undecaprenyl/decaprenyl-phosphate alpha-N-acetylglucosaminyl 1-phosphate transferase [Patescibacteria group bacterium]
MNLLLSFLIAFVFSLVAIPLLKKLAIKLHLYDDPKGDVLKIHKKPIPYLGGIGIFIGLSAGLGISRVFHQVSGLQALGLLVGSIIILFLGFWDDLKWKKFGNPLLKLFCQFLAGVAIILILIKIGVNFGFSINPWIGAIIAGFYIVGAMNALNMQDGMDGLAGGLSAISLLGFILLSFQGNNLFALTIGLGILGGILGFLFYNWNPASIFMGDNGSHFLGFSLALLAIMFSGHPVYSFRQFIGPILIIGWPIIDATWAIIRRLSQGKSPLSGDRGHLYDRLHLKGLSTKKTVLICYGVQAIIVGVGIIVYLM